MNEQTFRTNLSAIEQIRRLEEENAMLRRKLGIADEPKESIDLDKVELVFENGEFRWTEKEE